MKRLTAILSFTLFLLKVIMLGGDYNKFQNGNGTEIYCMFLNFKPQNM